jgi:hypothetical protein
VDLIVVLVLLVLLQCLAHLPAGVTGFVRFSRRVTALSGPRWWIQSPWSVAHVGARPLVLDAPEGGPGLFTQGLRPLQLSPSFPIIKLHKQVARHHGRALAEGQVHDDGIDLGYDGDGFIGFDRTDSGELVRQRLPEHRGRLDICGWWRECCRTRVVSTLLVAAHTCQD